ncbi:Ltp family lipoprotein [Sphingomonas sp. BN140010]|uniref:Ltp family lipoprotein n=1 Tax=Sphingomonas arvum TaxID=2992113 RepID=A0ABT3JHM5_9SPHN|nr:Ltp family lipoprotein [Sphingomonas sp. BN140010]MCW3798454.1 Ltp family lipoprotein [Sphingomonas sp. BN140010]
MYCIRCGAELPDGALYCPKCGKKQEDGAPYAGTSALHADVAATLNQPIVPEASANTSTSALSWIVGAILGLFGLFVIGVVAASIAAPNKVAEPSVANAVVGQNVVDIPTGPQVTEPTSNRAAENVAPDPVEKATVQEEEEDGSGLTSAQLNAVRSAQQYLNMTGFSREGLIQQLSSEYGSGYSRADATAAVDSLAVDWDENAVRSAQQYLEMTGFSCQKLIDQLSSDYGSKYTVEQATYGAHQAGAC